MAPGEGWSWEEGRGRAEPRPSSILPTKSPRRGGLCLGLKGSREVGGRARSVVGGAAGGLSRRVGMMKKGAAAAAAVLALAAGARADGHEACNTTIGELATEVRPAPSTPLPPPARPRLPPSGGPWEGRKGGWGRGAQPPSGPSQPVPARALPHRAALQPPDACSPPPCSGGSHEPCRSRALCGGRPRVGVGGLDLPREGKRRAP